MKRLDFVLPDFTRVVWVSDKARETWQPIFSRVAKAWWDIEWKSIVRGVRSCCLTMVPPEDFVDKGGEWVKNGLNNLPLSLQGVSTYETLSGSAKFDTSQPFVFRMVVGRPDHLVEFKRAWDEGDDLTIGKLLGYPACCMDFYRKCWVERGLVDTTWPVATGDPTLSDERLLVEVSGPDEANILWRWMGVRAVPHLPCSFNCGETVEFGKKMVSVGRDAGYAQEMDWMMEILSWPVEWSALHGIAEIKTPIVKISTLTDATPCKYAVRRQGGSYPAEGARGLDFPYTCAGSSFLGCDWTADKHPVEDGDVKNCPDWYASDNGFSTVGGMNSAHGPIVALASSFLAETGGNVLDLGCGNGALLLKIFRKNPDIVPYGIDVDPERIGHAKELLPGFAGNFESGNMFENPGGLWGEKLFSLAVIMPMRILEGEPESASGLREFLKKNCRSLLLYAYGDLLERFGSLSRLAEEAGFSLLDPDATVVASNVSAGFASVNG